MGNHYLLTEGAGATKASASTTRGVAPIGGDVAAVERHLQAVELVDDIERGNRRLNHALHCAAITQIRHRHSPVRSYYDRKLAEGKTPPEAIRSLKRRLSDVVWRHLVAVVRRVAAP
jgi:hypothetical protein